MKIFMLPEKADLGIGRVVEAYRRHLPAFDIEFVSSEDQANVVAVHAGTHADRQPDIHHCHGLYPTATLDTSEHFFDANADVIENARTAKIVTVPSQWVADIFRRDMLFNPVVVPHGIDLEEWPLVGIRWCGDYVLWAKGHTPGVCDPGVVNKVAKILPGVQFITTFGEPAPNVKVLGAQPFAEMQKLIRSAAVLLAPSKETFGIQTLEAMASGVPVVSYDWGGSSDIMTHMHDGYLAEPDNVDDLAQGIMWLLDHRNSVRLDARQTVIDNFTWEIVISRLAELYWNVHENGLVKTTPKVSVIIPCYNYGHCVAAAIESVVSQSVEGGFEVIVVDDGSTDDSAEVIERYKDQVMIIRTENSGSPAHSRNCGIRYASGEYIACLDADDKAVPGSLPLFANVLDADRGLGIVYGGLEIVYYNGEMRRKSEWPPDFCYKRQAIGQNQVPSFCMFRKEAWRRVGGYRAKYTPAEDAEFWLRITSAGYIARKCTDDETYIYDAHDGSLSRSMEQPNYVDDKPWTTDREQTPFAASACEYKLNSFPVRNYDDPWVSVIIPVGPRHADLAWRAVESVMLQSIPRWECIVVNDSGKDLIQPSTGQSLQDAYPFVRYLEVGDRNVSVARNTGAVVAQADFLSFLDADDWYLPDYLRETLLAYNDNPDHYVYTDWLSYNGETEKHQTRNFDCDRLKTEALHAVTALVPKVWHLDVGGFDEGLGVDGWEDWDYYLKIVLHTGHHGHRVKKALMVYDSTTGVRRDDSFANKDKLLPVIMGRYGDMDCPRGCGKGKKSRLADTLAVTQPNIVSQGDAIVSNDKLHTGRGMALPASSNPNRQREDKAKAMVNSGDVHVRENSGNQGGHRVIGAATRRMYGKRRHGQVFEMDVKDQRAQPHLYILVEQPRAKTTLQRPPAPARVSRPKAPLVQTPPPVVKEVRGAVVAGPTQLALDAHDLEEPEKTEELPDHNVDAEGIDVSMFTLAQVKKLGLEGEVAAEAYEAEVMGRARKSVLSYLESVAGDWLEEETDEELEMELVEA